MKELWATNLTNTDINLNDLQIHIPSFKSVNLLRKRGITLQQIEKSILSGSLSKKHNSIFLNTNRPIKSLPPIEISKSKPEIKEKTMVSITEDIYEELINDNNDNNDDKEFLKDELE
jgi:hypothetical protein